MTTQKIIQGDCLEVMKTFPDKSVDLVLTDPPYGLDIEYDGYIDSQENLQTLINTFVQEAQRIAPLVVIFPGIHNIWKYPEATWVGCWFYGTTGSWGKFGYNSWQPFLLYGKNNRRYGMDTIKYSKMEKRHPGHPCSKPIGLMEMMVERFSEDVQSVLDPFMGTGSTLLACKNKERNATGIEISPEYCKIAQQRLDSQSNSLFEV